ncbi:2-(acetamidomethylene)succinate hydrolase [Halioglobus japonicus]|nr:2-(acetamidomethylene)succinate hydrolase [Halioglobus japonicus]
MQEPREFRLDIGDIELAGIEWPGNGDPILLLHATGFHSHCWKQVVKQLPGRHIYAVDLRFHGASDSHGAVDWRLMTDDVCQLIEKLDLKQIVGAGHSIGGHLMARAAARMPERFKHVVLIDPVIMSAQRYAEFHTFSAGLKASDHPVSRRKNQWRDAQEMYERFCGRKPFNTWQPEVLRDYCDYALLPTGENALYPLACDPINEAGIYLNQIGNEIVLEELSSIVTPVTLLRAAPSDGAEPDLSTSPTWPGLAAALPNCREIYLPELNHFIPMQKPELVAHHIMAAYDHA